MKLFKFGRKDTVVESGNGASTTAKKRRGSNKNSNSTNNNNKEEEKSSHRSSTSSSSNTSSTRSKQPSSSPTIAEGKRDSFVMGNQATEQRMSDLSIMLSNFIVDSATKTYGSIPNEEEQADFLRDMSTAVRGSVIAPAGGYVENDEHYLEDITRNGKRNSDVVKFLVDASNGAMEAMETETEKNAFKQHLRNNLRMRFRLQRERAEHRRSQQQIKEQDDDNHHEQHDYSSNRHHRRSVWVHKIPSSTEDRNEDIDDDDDDISL